MNNYKLPSYYKGGKLYAAILRSEELATEEKFILSIIASYMSFTAPHGSRLVMKVGTICKLSGYNEDTVWESLELLQTENYLKIHRIENQDDCFSFELTSLIFVEYRDQMDGNEHE